MNRPPPLSPPPPVAHLQPWEGMMLARVRVEPLAETGKASALLAQEEWCLPS